MTDERDEEFGRLVASALKDHAADAPRAFDLAGEARRRLHRRRKRVMGAAVTAVAVVAIGSAVATNGLPSVSTDSSSAGAGAAGQDSGKEVPAQADSAAGSAWRWESYGGIQVRVPAAWTYGVSGSPWCIPTTAGQARGQRDGEVGRPGPVPSIGCPPSVPSSALGQHVWFDRNESELLLQPVAGWFRETHVVGGVRIEIQTRSAALRDQIIGSIREISTDFNGCPVRHPAAENRFVRPSQGLDWDTRVTGLSACKYSLTGGAPALIGSQRYAAPAATAILDRIRQAPDDGGPDDPGSTLPGHELGGELIVLRWSTPSGVREVYLRYSGSEHNGFDNGQEVRRLTSNAVTFVTGPLTVLSGHAGPLFPRPR
jgi:hypothetical protein